MGKLIIALDHNEISDPHELEPTVETIKLLMPSATHVFYASDSCEVDLIITTPCTCQKSKTFNLQ